MRSALLASLLFFAVFAVHSRSSAPPSNDSIWSVHVAKSLLVERDFDIDEYREKVRAMRAYAARKKRGHLYNFFPIGPSLVAVPFVWCVDRWPEHLLPLLSGKAPVPSAIDPPSIANRHAVERSAASTSVALAAVFLLFAISPVCGTSAACVLALAFAFCTPAWSTASRGLWQHGPGMMATSLGLLLLERGRRRSDLLALSAAAFALAYLMRPTNSIALAVFGAFVAWSAPRKLGFFVAASLVVLIPFFASSYTAYGSILPPYYKAGRLSIGPSFLEAAAANLVSPSRGLFVFAPFLAFGLCGRDRDPLRWAALCVVGLHLACVSAFDEWWAGHSYGPRFMSDTVPYLVYLTAIWLRSLGGRPCWERRALAGVFAVTVALGFWINWRGATSRSPHGWNVSPVNVDRDPTRVWDWSDPQFLR